VWRECSYGLAQQMEDFVDCVLYDTEPLETGEDGRAVLEIIFAAYESAGTGRRIDFPYEPPRDKTPIQMWDR